MNVPPGAPYAARVQLRGDHGAQPFAEGVLDTLESNGCGDLDMLACSAETPRCYWTPACEPLAHCAPLDQATCTGTTGCTWFGECLWRTDCFSFPQTLCESQPDCSWAGSSGCVPTNDCRSYLGPAGCSTNPACYWKQGCFDTQDCSAFATQVLCNGFGGCMWDGLCQASDDPSGCSSAFTLDDCFLNAQCFWDGSTGSCIAASGTTTVSGPIQNISIADVDVRDHDNVRVFTYFVQETGGGGGGINGDTSAEDAVVLSAELTFNVNPAQCEGLGQPSCIALAPSCSWISSLNRCAKAYPVQGQGTAYKMCLPGECKKARLISGARNSQFFTVFSAGEGGELFGDPRIQVSLASERVADLQSIDSSDTTFAIADGGGLWTRANLSANEQVVLFSSLSTVSDPFGLDGIWAVYSTCSNLGLNTVWKLNLAYCQSGCQAMENWTVNVVKTQAGIAGYECSGEWFGAMDIALDPIDKELYISYFADNDGTLGTGISDSDSYMLLRSGFLSIVEDQASVVGE